MLLRKVKPRAGTQSLFISNLRLGPFSKHFVYRKNAWPRTQAKFTSSSTTTTVNPSGMTPDQIASLEEERQLQEAIRLSLQDSVPNQPTQGTKRKAEDGSLLECQAEPTIRRLRAPASQQILASAQIRMVYPNGALRITRTPGRENARNCIGLSEIIHKKHLKAACIYSFFIAEDEFYPYLPLSHVADDVPIYIGRDPNMDSMVELARRRAGVPGALNGKVSRKELDSIRDHLQELHSQEYGKKNLHTFYAFCPGSAHSKILLLVYPSFIRIVITSCNMMEIDTSLGDNHFYIHDCPKLSEPSRSSPAGFEADLLAHMAVLGAPEQFLASIRGVYDYSGVKVYLITSVPGVCAGAKAEQHGLLRLRRVIKQLGLPPFEKLEVCTASVGNISAKWLSMFDECVRGKDTLKATYGLSTVPDMKLFYPTVSDVKNASEVARQGASNIGCHIRPWDTAPIEIKRIFHHYESKDKGCLFHQKFILAYNPKAQDKPPCFVYIGSANLSQSAWGMLEHDKRGNKNTSDKKLTKITNFECGVLIPGHLIVSNLLELGTQNWQNGIIPHVQSTTKYDLPKDKAWNSPEWVQFDRNTD
ncbi:tyrosyl-DNA phosphodiesterase-domain-containing protein [Xylariaceae sp. FL0255]|nr:tyrosyl-DNA phosphodiesterase-domain-containing protein [Xylariaceae sp. FL0255]